jgi:hypothetical protein
LYELFDEINIFLHQFLGFGGGTGIGTGSGSGFGGGYGGNAFAAGQGMSG